MKKPRFSERVIKIVSGIRRGKTMTYKEVARLAGNPKAARVVGSILNQAKKNIPPIYRLHCHTSL